MPTVLKVLLYYLHVRGGQRIFNSLKVKENNCFGREECTRSLQVFLEVAQVRPCPGTMGNTCTHTALVDVPQCL